MEKYNTLCKVLQETYNYHAISVGPTFENKELIGFYIQFSFIPTLEGNALRINIITRLKDFLYENDIKWNGWFHNDYIRVYDIDVDTFIGLFKIKGE